MSKQTLDWFKEQEMSQVVCVLPNGDEKLIDIMSEKDAKYYFEMQDRGYLFRIEVISSGEKLWYTGRSRALVKVARARYYRSRSRKYLLSQKATAATGSFLIYSGQLNLKIKKLCYTEIGMNNKNIKNNELAEAVYREIFPSVEAVREEITREIRARREVRFNRGSLVRNPQVGINSLKK